MSISFDIPAELAFQHALPSVIPDRESALRIARDLAPAFAARVEQTERGRSVPSESIAELLDSGLFGIVTPKSWGGSELGFATLFEVQAEIASACTSTGWVYGVLAGHTWLASLFSEEAQQEIFADPRVLIASLVRLGGTPPERVEGGYRWSGGQGRFCSGIDHSTWVLAGGQLTSEDGSSERLYFLIPKRDIEVIDDWDTVGLNGTGSKSILVKDAFIPEHRVIRFADLLTGTAPGAHLHDETHYHLAYDSVWPLSLPGAAIGGARAAVAEFTAATSKRVTSMSAIGQASNGPAFARLAASAAQIDSAAALLLADARSIDEARPGTVFDELEKTRRQRNLAFAVQQARDAVNTLYEASGGSGVYRTGAMQRWWRDVNVASQHVMFTWDLAAVAYGRSATGIGNSGEGGAKIGPGIPAGSRG